MKKAIASQEILFFIEFKMKKKKIFIRCQLEPGNPASAFTERGPATFVLFQVRKGFVFGPSKRMLLQTPTCLSLLYMKHWYERIKSKGANMKELIQKFTQTVHSCRCMSSSTDITR
jgi:hypothetical protein